MRYWARVIRKGAHLIFVCALCSVIAPRPLSALFQISGVPQDLEYEIIQESTSQADRRSLDVRLSHKVSKEVLEALAIHLRDQPDRDFARTFIVYYLPGMEVDAGGWATSHFTPSLEIRILGTPLGVVGSNDESEAIVGRWENNQPGFAGVYAISETASGFELERTFPDGSSSLKTLVEEPSPTGRRFRDPDNRFGEYWLIRNGKLELHDQEGLVFDAQPVH